MERLTLGDIERRREELERRRMKAVALLLSEAAEGEGALSRKSLEDVLRLAELALEEARRSYAWLGERKLKLLLGE